MGTLFKAEKISRSDSYPILARSDSDSTFASSASDPMIASVGQPASDPHHRPSGSLHVCRERSEGRRQEVRGAGRGSAVRGKGEARVRGGEESRGLGVRAGAAQAQPRRSAAAAIRYL